MTEYHEETLKTYKFTVEKKGNKQTFEEFKNKMRLEWLAERVRGSASRTKKGDG